MKRLYLYPYPTHSSGYILVELLVAIAIAAIMLPALLTAVVAAREGRAQESQRLQATALFREANEAVRSVREKGWINVATNGTYRPVVSGNSWSLAAGAETVNGFTRQVVIADTRRNSAGAVVDSGGTVDPSTKKVTISVSWTTPMASVVADDVYISRYLGNTTDTDTTQADFTPGVVANTEVVNASGGEVQLAAVPITVNWTSPTIAGSYNATGSTASLEVVVSGNYAYLANGTSLRIIDITNPAAPTLTGSYTASGVINGVDVEGNYVYLALATNTAEFTVVNVTNPAAPTLAGTLNLGDTVDANTVFLDSNYAYVGKVSSATGGINEFYIINITTPTAPSLSGSLNLSGDINSIHVSGNYAYVATAITTAELTIVNVTNKAAPTQAGVYNAAGTVAATDVFAVGTNVYLTRLNNTGGAEFFIVNAATPATPTLVGSYEAGAAINGVYVTGTSAFLATARTNQQFMVLNLTTPATPTVTGSTNLTNASNDLVQVGNYAYVASANTSRELTIMQGVVSGGGYQASGTYESPTFDAGASVGFNYLTFTITEPASTNVQFQVATNNNNATWNYVGPDGTAGTSYTAPGAFALNVSNARYLRWRATLTGPGTATPVTQDVTVNYSP